MSSVQNPCGGVIEWASARVPPTPLLGGWAEGGWRGACLIDDDEDDGDSNKPSNGVWEQVFCEGRRCEGKSICLHLPRLQRECGQ